MPLLELRLDDQMFQLLQDVAKLELRTIEDQALACVFSQLGIYQKRLNGLASPTLLPGMPSVLTSDEADVIGNTGENLLWRSHPESSADVGPIAKAGQTPSDDTRLKRANNKSGFVGVYPFGKTRWQARVVVDKAPYYLRPFDTPLEAARARCAWLDVAVAAGQEVRAPGRPALAAVGNESMIGSPAHKAWFLSRFAETGLNDNAEVLYENYLQALRAEDRR
jgi:hypothetical protein